MRFLYNSSLELLSVSSGSSYFTRLFILMGGHIWLLGPIGAAVTFFFTAHSVLVSGDISGDPWATEMEGDSAISVPVVQVDTAKVQSRTFPVCWTERAERTWALKFCIWPNPLQTLRELGASEMILLRWLNIGAFVYLYPTAVVSPEGMILRPSVCYNWSVGISSSLTSWLDPPYRTPG